MAQARLQKYVEKRDFSKTAEPSGKGKGSSKRAARGRSYLIQKHDASRLHYDFRLEHDGVLMSWAIPKGPSLDPADKRLAVHVEDHPIDYGAFEGTIPKGQYGGGTVMLWDRGDWEPQGDVDEGLRKGNLKFELHGERLKGGFALVRLNGRNKKYGGKDNWLLIKEKDDRVKKGGKLPTEMNVRSVATGRTMDEISRGDDVWQSKPKATAKGRAATEAKSPARKLKTSADSGAKKKSAPKKSGAQKIPAFVAPQLATLVDAAPAGADWLHEIKYDGYRAIASMAGGQVVIRTRTGLDWTDRFHALVAPLSELPCDSALLDGEIAVADDKGHTNFGALQNALSEGRGGFGYYLFDLLHLDGEDLRNRPLIERKARLKKLLADVGKNGSLYFSDYVEGQGSTVFEQACKLQLEGIIAKQADSRYVSGRSQNWLKIKCGMEQEFIIVGWRESDKAGRPFSSILLAVREGDALRYCGRVGSGYTEGRLGDLAKKFKQHARKTPAVEGIPREIMRDAHFLEPVLVAEVALRGWTRDGMVRQGSFKGLREDKPARAIVRETPMPTEKAVKRAAARSAQPKKAARKKTAMTRAPKKSGDERDTIEGVHITHPDRALFAAENITKQDLIEYYLKVADLMLPHVVARPLALVRCPGGSDGECFFQKHASQGWPEQFEEIRIKEKSGSDKYLYVENVSGLVAAVQMSVLELHLWGSQADDVEHPDRMVFDLDPDEGLDFGDVKEAAQDLKKRLADLGLKSFPMVTGGKGIHVVVPLMRGHSWDQHREFSEALARVMAEEEPSRFVANMSKAKRRGKIFVDYLRNQRGSTAIAPYSTRARPGAHVALPMTWQAVARTDSAHPVSVKDAARIVRGGNPWPDYFRLKQKLPKFGG